MPAYAIVLIDVSDPDLYEDYKTAAGVSVVAHGGRYVVRGGAIDVLEGDPPAGRVVMVEFPDMAAARRFYDSEDYQRAAAIRRRAATSSLYVVEGV